MLEVGHSSQQTLARRWANGGRSRPSNYETHLSGQATADKYLLIYPDNQNVKFSEDFILVHLSDTLEDYIPTTVTLANVIDPRQFSSLVTEDELEGYLPYIGFEIVGLVADGANGANGVTRPVAIPVLGFLPKRKTVGVKVCPHTSGKGLVAISRKNVSAYGSLISHALLCTGYNTVSPQKHDEASGRVSHLVRSLYLCFLEKDNYFMFQHELNLRIYRLFWNAMSKVVPQFCQRFQQKYSESPSITGFKPRVVKSHTQQMLDFKGCYLLAFYDYDKAIKIAEKIGAELNQTPSEKFDRRSSDRAVQIRYELHQLLSEGFRGILQTGPRYLRLQLVYPQLVRRAAR